MKKYIYYLQFSPHPIGLWAKNRADAWAKLEKIWPGYREIITLLRT